ncbi:thiamine pyrophosphate-binding protein [Dactylosporangium sp. NPDC051484]|uniref:thiamine pyrophosphate-binding protein n=1 Tax=Dactylosporangium sp. NPDC051484 TaxID=3154942 RepID=UPI00344FC738
MMAQGYAARSGWLGVVAVTEEPGLTNTATALVELVRSSAPAPVLLLGGDTAPNNTINLQSLDQEAFGRGAGADLLTVDKPQDAPPSSGSGRAAALPAPGTPCVPSPVGWGLR